MDLTPNKNFLQPTGFCVIIERSFGNLKFFAHTVSHPGATGAAAEMAVPRVQRLPLPPDTINYGELTISLILDEDLTCYKEVLDWMEGITYGTRETTYHDIQVIILTSHNNSNVTIKYKNCIPTQVGNIELTSTAGDVTYLNFDATFRFTEYEII